MKRIALATLVSFGLAATAAAQQTRTPPGDDRTNQVRFEEVDKDKDGQLNREEGNSINGFDFSRADTDNNKLLTRAEFNAAMATSTARGDGHEGPLEGDRTEQVSFEKADKNSDGKLDRDEARDIDGFNFTAADADDDRWVTRAEFQTAMADSHPRG
jgi:Ca2+-binding EF-hand superfamily protein